MTGYFGLGVAGSFLHAFILMVAVDAKPKGI